MQVQRKAQKAEPSVVPDGVPRGRRARVVTAHKVPANSGREEEQAKAVVRAQALVDGAQSQNQGRELLHRKDSEDPGEVGEVEREEEEGVDGVVDPAREHVEVLRVLEDPEAGVGDEKAEEVDGDELGRRRLRHPDRGVPRDGRAGAPVVPHNVRGDAGPRRGGYGRRQARGDPSPPLARPDVPGARRVEGAVARAPHGQTPHELPPRLEGDGIEPGRERHRRRRRRRRR